MNHRKSKKKKVGQRLFRKIRKLVDFLARLVSPNDPQSDKVLVLRLDDLGDFALWIPFALALKGAFPDKTLTLVGNRLWMGLAEVMGLADRYVGLNPRRLRYDLLYRALSICRIRRENASTVIQPRASGSPFLGDDISLHLGARHAIIAVPKAAEYPLPQLSNDAIDVKAVKAESEEFESEIIKNSRFLELIGLPLTQPDYKSVSLKLVKVIKELPQPELPAYVVISPGAGWNGRRWPVRRFAEIGKRLWSEYGLTTVLTGSKSESRIGDEFSRQSKNVRVVDLIGATEVMELARLILHSKLLISNESGTAHLGALMGVPTICILGGGHFGRFLPQESHVWTIEPQPTFVFNKLDCYFCNWECPYPRGEAAAVKCIDTVHLEGVWEKVEAILGSGIAVNRS